MLPLFRTLARPLSVLLLVALSAPAIALDCREMSAMSAAGMSCCRSTGEAGVKADCCAVSEPDGTPVQPPATTAASRGDVYVQAAVGATLAAEPLAPRAAVALTVADAGPPLDRLYIRFAVIRR